MTVKFLQNGIKVDGRYIPVFYDFGDDHLSVTVYAREYDKLPVELGAIKNESDLIADYHETDRCEITHDNPFFFAAYAAARQKRMTELKKQLTVAEKKRADDPIYCEIMSESIRAEMARLVK